MTVNLPSLSDPIASALSVPIPFLFAVVAISVVIWRVFEWRYRAVIEKTKVLYDLSKLETQHAQQAAANKEATLSATVASLKQEIGELTARLEKQPGGLPADVVPALKQLTQTSTLANNQIGELRKANNAVADALRSWIVAEPISPDFPGSIHKR